MKVLVSGATGFLGRHIVDELDRLLYSIDTIGRSGKATLFSDLTKEMAAITNKYDLVVHVAGKAHLVPRTEEEKQDFYNVNFEGTKHLLEALIHPPKNFVFISTVSVYGLDFGNNISENAPLTSDEPYGKSKIMAEGLITKWGETKNVTTTILRLPLLFGKNPPGNLESMINAIKGNYYFNIGKGDVRKSMVFASDVAAFIPNIMKFGGIYNLTDGFHPSFKELSDEIASFHKRRNSISIPFFVIKILANLGELMQKVSKKKMPLNKRQFIKMTKPLTFNDNKARDLGWMPRKIIDHPDDWLT